MSSHGVVDRLHAQAGLGILPSKPGAGICAIVAQDTAWTCAFSTPATPRCPLHSHPANASVLPRRLCDVDSQVRYRFAMPVLRVDFCPPFLQSVGDVGCSGRHDTEPLAKLAEGALLGSNVGAEAATRSPLQHLLWPNRHLSNLSASSVFAIVILTPMGGPMHKAALQILDTLYTHGLFQGQHHGHMLGTAFFEDIGWTHTLCSPGQEPRTTASRNCLWATALAMLRVPDLKQNSQGGQESPGERQEKGIKNTSIRARTSVHHLTFSPATTQDKDSNLPFVKEDVETPKILVFATIILGELTAIVAAALLIAVARTPWAALWLARLALRLLSAAFTLHREPLIPVTDAMAKDEHDILDINCPQSNGSFMIFTGPPAIVSQFMRHYGHPVRPPPPERSFS
ncbi:hypothetical protein MGU_07947 [Metarhizium guizhouense ARSEF 977]|uniref:Uncharacterized protein n=1 Tax=Metarhizium guizhouense (strain ARSEF 977) TaxID=1276136 RepID=A0A0B4GYJ3_METGA|nr:hypothetical protein MGU_07947 [Metarhizium guizhouense ARSEF 977]